MSSSQSLAVDLEKRLVQLASDAALAGVDDPSVGGVRRPTRAALDEALRSHREVLAVVGDGIRLTQSGYLPPATVRAIAPLLPVMSNWIFEVEREVHAQPVLVFREHLAAVGLLRKSKGRLMVTAAGARGLRDSEVLWGHLAERLVPSRSAFDGMAWALILLHIATSPSRRVDVHRLAETLTALGWKQQGGGPIVAGDVQWIVNDVWGALGNVGVPIGSRAGSRIVSDAAVALIRDVLFVEA